MTNEDRQKLCERLRGLANNTTYFSVCDMAAGEIERLDAECCKAIQGRIHAEGALLKASAAIVDYIRNHAKSIRDD